MIDIGEPVRKQYSEEEKKILTQNFFITLHGFLVLYLALHNLFIPVVANLFKGHVIWENVHFWFLVHIPINFYLRRAPLPLGAFLFLLFGSLTRLGLECFLASKLASWVILSVLLSELATLLFLFFYYSEVKEKKRYLFAGPLLGILFAGGILISEMFIRPEYSQMTQNREKELKSYGCQGSLNEVSFPLKKTKTVSDIKITGCGFATDEVYVEKQLLIQNNSTHQLNLRIYEAKWSAGRLSWKFKRILQVSDNNTLNLEEYIEFKKPILIKVPERKNLGHLLILPVDSSESFPKGELRLTYDTLHWTDHE